MPAAFTIFDAAIDFRHVFAMIIDIFIFAL